MEGRAAAVAPLPLLARRGLHRARRERLLTACPATGATSGDGIAGLVAAPLRSRPPVG